MRPSKSASPARFRPQIACHRVYRAIRVASPIPRVVQLRSSQAKSTLLSSILVWYCDSYTRIRMPFRNPHQIKTKRSIRAGVSAVSPVSRHAPITPGEPSVAGHRSHSAVTRSSEPAEAAGSGTRTRNQARGQARSIASSSAMRGRRSPRSLGSAACSAYSSGVTGVGWPRHIARTSMSMRGPTRRARCSRV
jgi:hypothetical protein